MFYCSRVILNISVTLSQPIRAAQLHSELVVLVSCKNWAEIEAIDQGWIRVLDMIDVSPD